MASNALCLTLPVPPSANHLWRNLRGATLLSKAARTYRKVVGEAVLMRGPGVSLPLTGRLRLTIILTAPDRRRRDLDNCIKPIQDALTHAGVWVDDEQIDALIIHRDPPNKAQPGVYVAVSELGLDIENPPSGGSLTPHADQESA